MKKLKRWDDPDVRRRYNQAYYRRNAERLKAATRARYRANADHIRAAERARYQRDREELKASARARYHQNSPRRLLTMWRWRQNNRERAAASQNAWRKANRERVLARCRQRYQEGYERLALALRSRLRIAVRSNARAGSAVRDLGCTIAQFKDYIATLFKPGMSWENWGEWHLDHIWPLASFDLGNEEHVRYACHYSNIRPLWAVENLRKGAKVA